MVSIYWELIVLHFPSQLTKEYTFQNKFITSKEHGKSANKANLKSFTCDQPEQL